MFTGLFHALALLRVVYVLAREGAFAEVDPVNVPAPARPLLALSRLIARSGRRGPGRIPVALARLGPSYVKFGQFLATRPDVVGARLAQALEELQDRMPPFDQATAEAVVEANLMLPLRESFAEFGPPVAAASIAQVHKAVVEDAQGRRAVAVKVLRPGTARRFRRDLKFFYFGAHFAERHLPGFERLNPVAIVDVLARSVSMEMDLRLEAAALSEMAQNIADDPGFRVPRPDWERTGREVLTMEWIDGTSLNNLPALRETGFDLPALGRTVIQSFLRHALRDGFFHADMHQGNLFVDREGNLTAVDFGIMGRIGPKERRFLAEILFGFITRDYRRVAEVHFEAGYVPSHHSVDDFAQAIRAIGEPIHEKTADQISMARLLTLLFEITDLFDMKTRTELVMLQKTMVVVEGVARSLDPRVDMWSASEPVVREWIERNLGPVGLLGQAGGDLRSLMRSMLRLPDLLERVTRNADAIEGMTRHGVTIAPASIAAIGEAAGRASRWASRALWIIAVLLLGFVVLGR